MSQAEDQQKRRKKKIDKGLCCQCGKEKIFKAKRCKTCYSKVREATKRTREKRHNEGRCINCGENPHEKNKKRCSVCLKKQRDWYKDSNYRETNLKIDAKRRINNRRLVLEAYGGKCACCQESEKLFLTIDHINEDGAEHREKLAGDRKKGRSYGSNAFYRWLVKNDFPKDNFQLLCMNCNFGKHRNKGVCPHQQKGNDK